MAFSQLRYQSGALPGKKRKQPTDPVSSKRAYEVKRVRTFQQSWQSGREWLQYDPETQLMRCQLCIEFYGPSSNDNIFIKGSSYLRIDGIQLHENSPNHFKAVQAKQAKSTPKSSSTAAKALKTLRQADYDKLVNKFRNAHAVCKNNLSFKTYEMICQLDKMKGLPTSSQYESDKACAEFCTSISRTTRNDSLSSIKSANWCSLMIDGSTDFTGDDMESLYVRSSSNGYVRDIFLDIGCSASACSADIHSHVLQVLQDLELTDVMKEKLVGFCSDGAANMMGIHSGVSSLLKKDWPHLVVTHCVAHRLELAFKDAMKKCAPKNYEKLTSLLMGLFYLFRRSPKQKKGLERAAEALHMKMLLPTRIGGTRWLPHFEKALNIFSRGYKLFLYQLENASHQNAKAEGLAKMMRDGNLILYMLSLKRVISNLQSLSLYLQTDLISLADAARRVQSSKTAISQLYSTFGDKEVETLYRQFEDVAFGKSSEGIALEDVLDQWATLRTLIYHRYPFQDRQKLTWVTVMGSMADQQLYAVFTLIDITLALPPTSVKCETSFSAMKLLKNKRRGRLRAGRLNDVMMVKLTSPSINEFDPDLAIKHWMTSTPSGQPRRIKREAPGSQGDCIVVSEEDEKDVASNKVPENSEYEDDDDDDDDEDMEMSAEHAFSVVLKNE
ncbi:zinc finger protein 862-like isoform X2 [Dreissena polymorpha]|uniref:zinc finger protein 862-like isoform X2 n=2 Tax=Dreissena polymorpha TaxID=45954 RepID=UPI002264BFD5|nr:zinc finger protein 862-like isoform X2 [Dreissena polymorpha]